MLCYGDQLVIIMIKIRIHLQNRGVFKDGPERRSSHLPYLESLLLLRYKATRSTSPSPSLSPPLHNTTIIITTTIITITIITTTNTTTCRTEELTALPRGCTQPLSPSRFRSGIGTCICGRQGTQIPGHCHNHDDDLQNTSKDEYEDIDIIGC